MRGPLRGAKDVEVLVAQNALPNLLVEEKVHVLRAARACARCDDQDAGTARGGLIMNVA